MYYSDELIEEIRSRNDIVDVISGYVKLTKKGSSHFGLCPFHNEKSPSFSVSGAKQMFYCFGCGAGGNVFSFIMKYENFTFLEAVKMLAERAGIALPEIEMTSEEKRQQNLKAQLFDINRDAAMYYHKLLRTENGKMAYNYLHNRQLTDDTIVHFGLGASGMYKDELYRYMKSKNYSDEILKETGLFVYNEYGVHDRFRNRAMFPILNINNKVIGFGGRVMGDGEPKYLNSPETKIFDKGRNLFGLNMARISKKNNLIICEGYMDVIALHQAGFNQAVASLGTALTSGHASLMKRYTQDVLVCYDSDGAGTKAAVKAINILRAVGIRTKVINMKPYKDPDEFIKNLGADAFQERIDKAQNSFMFELSILERSYDMNDPAGKTAFLNAAAVKLVEFRDEIERNNYIDAVAAEYFVSSDSLNRLVIKQASIVGLAKNDESDSEKSNNKGPKGEKDNAIKMAQRVLLTWLIEQPGLYEQVSRYISQEDFTEPVYHKVAGLLFEQFKQGNINAAGIISHFEEEEEQKVAASLFNTELPELVDERDRQKAIDDVVFRIKKNRLDMRSRNAKDISELQEIIRQQNSLKNIHINLN